MKFTVDGVNNGSYNYDNVRSTPVIRFKFSSPVQSSGIAFPFFFVRQCYARFQLLHNYRIRTALLIISPTNPLSGFKKYTLVVSSDLKSSANGNLANAVTLQITTGIDSTDKFPQITDSALLTLVEQQTFKYFWDFGHPVSGLARERTSSSDVVTTGGSGFGIMAMLVAVQRNFITRADALTRMDTIVSFLTKKVISISWRIPALDQWRNGRHGSFWSAG